MAFHAIIPAGGIGARLWPLSRRHHPKFLEDFTGNGRSMLQETYNRLAPLADTQTIVTGSAHADEVRAQLPQADIIVEPNPRGTMGAIGLAAARIAQRDPHALVGSFAADHHIRDVAVFHDALTQAIEAARTGYVATIGIAPTSPSSAYGYIRQGDSIGIQNAYHVEQFVEKPDVATAQKYVDAGTYVWNAGMFIAQASVLLDALERFRPDIARPLFALASQWDTPQRLEAIAEYWDTLPVDVIDRAIAEPLAAEGGVAVVPADMGWSDVGDFASLADIARATPELSPTTPTVCVDSARPYVRASKPVAVVGIDDVVVVETDDVILVTKSDRAQDVKKVVDQLDEKGLDFLA